MPGLEADHLLMAGFSTVLCIDDDPDACALVSVILGHRGYQVLSALNGAGGLAVAQQIAAGLILLDLWLPDMHGTEVSRRLRGDKGTSAIPVLGFSVGSPPTAAALAEAGMVGFVSKPLDDIAAFVGVVETEITRD